MRLNGALGISVCLLFATLGCSSSSKESTRDGASPNDLEFDHPGAQDLPAPGSDLEIDHSGSGDLPTPAIDTGIGHPEAGDVPPPAVDTGIDHPGIGDLPTPAIDSGIDHPGTGDLPAPSIDTNLDSSVIDGSAVASACPDCGADELCVAYYDGTCMPMSTGCRKVSAETRDRILVKHENCFLNPLGNDVCGTRNGQTFWGCGDPPCPNETLLSDINCYGP